MLGTCPSKRTRTTATSAQTASRIVTKPTALLNHYVSHRRARHARVLDAVQAGHRIVADISREAYADSPEAHPGLAQDQTLAHLLAHAQQGTVRQHNGGWHPA